MSELLPETPAAGLARDFATVRRAERDAVLRLLTRLPCGPGAWAFREKLKAAILARGDGPPEHADAKVDVGAPLVPSVRLRATPVR